MTESGGVAAYDDEGRTAAESPSDWPTVRCSRSALEVLTGTPDQPYTWDVHPIECAPGRRLGQHVVRWQGDGAETRIALDVLLRTLHAPLSSGRYVIRWHDDVDALHSAIRIGCASPVLVRLESDSCWLVDADQLAVLRANHGEPTVVPTRSDAARGMCGLADSHRYAFATGAKPSPATPPSDLHPYGTPAPDAVRPRADGEHRFLVRASFGSLSGAAGVELTAAQLEVLPKVRDGSWVALSRDVPTASGPLRLSVPARVRTTTTTEPGDSLGVDAVLRAALGVDVHEAIDMLPISEFRSARWSRAPTERNAWLLARRERLAERAMPAVFVVARVQPAELTLTEQNAVLLSPLAIDALGIASGDEIIVHAVAVTGVTAQDGPAIHTRKAVKAYAVPDDVLERRMRTYGGGVSAPLPSEEDAFGMPQALPWIWMDATLRRQLGIPLKLGSVHVTASRSFVLTDHFRELAFVIALALFSLVVTAPDPARWILGAFAVVIPSVLIALRVRKRLR